MLVFLHRQPGCCLHAAFGLSLRLLSLRLRGIECSPPHHVEDGYYLLAGEEVDRDPPILRPDAVVVIPEPKAGHRLLQLPLEVRGGRLQLREVVHELDEVGHAVLGLGQLGEVDRGGVEGIHRAVLVVLVELVQLRRGEDLDCPTLRRLRDDVKQDLAQLHLGQRAILQEDVQEAVPIYRVGEAGQLQQVLQDVRGPLPLDHDHPGHAGRAGLVHAALEGHRVVLLELPEEPVQLLHLPRSHGQGGDELHHLVRGLRRLEPQHGLEAPLEGQRHLRGQAVS
mmetsp:Transcript_31005/g.82120  ORF Transcript_31005/g.82120 Transcript_31005/m.82120 type:complete len:281 (+) Transcript_31005:839-1681(+)